MTLKSCNCRMQWIFVFVCARAVMHNAYDLIAPYHLHSELVMTNKMDSNNHNFPKRSIM